MSGERLPVSVVTPAYRRPDLLERALRSVHAQHCPPDEVIVVDDGSGDDTAARAEALGARVIVHPENRGESAARNTGFAAARNDWIALLDSDDEWFPNHLSTVWAVRDGHVLVGTPNLGAGPRPEHHRLFGWPGRRPLLLDSPAKVALPENMVAVSCVMLRRDVVGEVGGFRADLHRAEDLDLWIRMLERGTGLIVPEVTGLYHQHDDQISAERPRMWDARLDVIESFADRPWCTPGLRARHEGIRAWDAARLALASGEPRAPTLVRLARELGSPGRAAGVIQLLRYRAALRRASRRLESAP